MYDPDSGTLHEAAPNQVGRNYHATALLLPDGRVMTMGSDPLFADAERTKSGTFETRLEIYSPPYLFAGDRPELTEAPHGDHPGRVLRGLRRTARSPRPGCCGRAR